MAERGLAAERSIGQAPGDLATVQAFVNTKDIEQAADALGSPAALTGWLRAAGLLGGQKAGEPPVRVAAADGASEADLDLAVRVREALRAVLRSHAGHGSATGAASELATIAAGLSAHIDVSPAGLIRVAAAGRGVRPALARLLLITAEAGLLGTWSRLKACSADDCQWAFYDRSPTRNGCWCSMRICGSRAKSRAYRRRVAAQGVT